tara:strand:- start:749 stop:868 length:120 start_codon:yes stop_codon:yes gene_type:complete
MHIFHKERLGRIQMVSGDAEKMIEGSGGYGPVDFAPVNL